MTASDRGDGRVFKRKGSSRWWIQFNVHGRQIRESGGRTPEEARKKLKRRLREAARDDFAGPSAERVLIGSLLDELLLDLQHRGRRSWPKVESHLKTIRAFFGDRRAVTLTSTDIERYKKARRAEGKQNATINRELEALNQAYRHASRQTPPLFPPGRLPYIALLPVDNVRQGFFTVAEVTALLRHIPDPDICDFIEWAFRTGMRKSEIAGLTWDMLDRTGNLGVLRPQAAITKNRRGRSIGLQGEVRATIERRLATRRLDCPLIFHRTSKGRAGQPVRGFDKMWRNALEAAGLPLGRLFHDLRRSAVRNLIRAGVDESTAMKVSGHRTRSMLDRYNIIEETETAAALAQVDEWLSTQPKSRNVEEGQFGDIRAEAGRKSLPVSGDWRKRVGIEPTAPGINPEPDGFEGRAGHQTRIASVRDLEICWAHCTELRQGLFAWATLQNGPEVFRVRITKTVGRPAR